MVLTGVHYAPCTMVERKQRHKLCIMPHYDRITRTAIQRAQDRTCSSFEGGARARRVGFFFFYAQPIHRPRFPPAGLRCVVSHSPKRPPAPGAFRCCSAITSCPPPNTRYPTPPLSSERQPEAPWPPAPVRHVVHQSAHRTDLNGVWIVKLIPLRVPS